MAGDAAGPDPFGPGGLTPPLGVLCGAGWLAEELIRRLDAEAVDHFILAFDGQTPEPLFQDRPHARVRIGAAGRAIKELRTAGCRDLVMVGSLARPPKAALRPDVWTAAFLARTGAYKGGDDGLLSTLIHELEARQGFRVLDVADLMPDLIAADGACGTLAVPETAQAAVAAAVAGARRLGRDDRGQACVAGASGVIAEEGRGGTAAMLGDLADSGGAPGAVLAKMLKPGQETRVDRPAIGPDTVAQAARAGLAGIVVEAGHALILDRARVIDAADRSGLFVCGVGGDGAGA
jgi:DUF1009 family protein